MMPVCILRCIITALLLQCLWAVASAAIICGSPRGVTCPSHSASAKSKLYDFRAEALSLFELSSEVSADDHDSEHGASLSIRNDDDAPTITLPKYFHYGKFEVFVKGVAADGIVTAVSLRSGNLDQIALVRLQLSSYIASSRSDMN
jgi:hypothetical protein